MVLTSKKTALTVKKTLTMHPFLHIWESWQFTSWNRKFI